MALKNQNQTICGNCGSMNSKGTKTEGGRSVILFLILLCFMIVPGLLYWGFASKQKKSTVCTACGADNQLFPLSSPKGKLLYKEYHGDKEFFKPN